jgi:hypothetical protein
MRRDNRELKHGMTYFLKIPRSVLNLEPSSGTFSTAAFEGVAARDVSLELSAEVVVEPGRALSAARSAIVSRLCCSRTVEKMKREVSSQAPRTPSSNVVVKCGSAL